MRASFASSTSRFGDIEASLASSTAFMHVACMIARYELLMTRRRFARDRLVLSEDIVKLLADEAADELPMRNRQLEALEGCIQRLPKERRELALAAYGRDQSIREMAAQLGRSEGSLYQLLARIRKELQRCIERTINQTS